MVERGRVRRLRRRHDQFRQRGRPLAEKPNPLRGPLRRGRHRPRRPRKLEPGCHLGGFAAVWRCDGARQGQKREAGPHPVWA